MVRYPFFKNLRELCYKLVEDRRGNEPLFLIYPRDYYRLLFANNCEELTDIIVSMAKLI